VLERSEEKLRKALATARRAGSVALELRAATDLGRLLHESGQNEEAGRLLTGVYATFTEGFDTPDLQAACTLLAAIRSVSTAD
jgi:predicted ATPase